MKPSDKKALSWTVSLFIHAVGAALIIWSSFHIAVPPGEVTTVTTFTDKTDVDVVDSAKEQAPITPEQPPAEEEKVEPTQEEAMQAQEVPPAEIQKEDEVTEKAAPPVAGETDKATDTSPADTSQEDADQPADTETSSDVAAATSPADGTPSETPATAVQPQAPSAGNTLDESKLSEVEGNRKPDYPWMARLRHQEGTVVLKAFVKPDGQVDQVALDKSSGWPLLDQECVRSYARWRYHAGPSGWVIKSFIFNLK